MSDDANPPSDMDGGEKLILNSPAEAHSPKDFALWAGVIVLAVLSAFSPAMHGKYLWDDDRHVENNRDLRDAAGLGDIWTGHWRLLLAPAEQRKQVRDVYTPQYYPFTHTTYWIEAQIFGTANPTVFHVTNMLLHAAAAVLLWFVLRELAVPGAWVAAAIFALHPVNVESVAWISERKNVLAGALAFGALLAYLKSPMGLKRDETVAMKDRDLTLYFVAVGLFILAVLSKTIACSLPAVVLLLFWWKRGKVTWSDVAWAAPMFIVGLVLALFTSWIEVHHIGAAGKEWQLNFVQRILLAGNAIWFYAGKLVWPARLTFIYPKWNLDPARPELWIGPVAVIVVLAALFALRKRIGRGPLIAALIFIGVLVPALGFFSVYPMRFSYVADHFQYLAGPALIALIVAALAKVVTKLPTPTPFVICGIVLLALAITTAVHASIFAGPLELWTDTAAKNPYSAMVRYNTGVAQFYSIKEFSPEQEKEIAQRLDAAKENFEAATKIDPNHIRAWEMWGDVLLAQKKPAEAMEKFDHVITVDAGRWSRGEITPPEREPAVDAAMGRGKALVALKKPEDAILAYKWAIAILETQRPYASRIKAATCFGMIGRLLAQKGDQKGAIENLKQAMAIEPNLAFPHYEYAKILLADGDKNGAASQFDAAIEADRDFADAMISLGRLRIDVGNLKGAQLSLADAAMAMRRRGVAFESNPEFPRWRDAVLAFDAAYRAATRPATTRATTRAATAPTTPQSIEQSLRSLSQTRDITSEVFTAPTTQPSR